jgi:hypothetical protein
VRINFFCDLLKLLKRAAFTGSKNLVKDCDHASTFHRMLEGYRIRSWWGDAHAVTAPKTVIFLSFKGAIAFRNVDPVVTTSSTRIMGRLIAIELLN